MRVGLIFTENKGEKTMNGKKLLRAAAVLLLVLACSAMTVGCIHISIGSRFVTLTGDCTTLRETPDANEVYRIEIDNMSFTDSKNVSINIAYSDTPYVEAVVSEDLLDYGFAITMKNGVLRVAPNKHLEIKTDCFELTIHARFDEVELSGGYDVTVDADGAETLSLRVSGAADGRIDNLHVRDFEAKVSGAGSFALSGEAEKATIHISGAGDIEAAGLVCGALDAKISGAGDMTVSVLDALDAKISGVGSIAYYGSPTVTQSVSGLGTVTQQAAKLPGA